MLDLVDTSNGDQNIVYTDFKEHTRLVPDVIDMETKPSQLAQQLEWKPWFLSSNCNWGLNLRISQNYLGKKNLLRF